MTQAADFQYIEGTKLIPLTQGKFAIVDAEDYEFLMQWKWYAHKRMHTFYAIRKTPRNGGQGKVIWMHRLINQTSEGMDTDHINANGLDNRKSNLRNCTRAQNLMNSRARKNSTSKYKGVCWDKSKNKWMVRINVNGICKNIGRFHSEEDAALAYNSSAILLHGEFARLNNVLALQGGV